MFNHAKECLHTEFRRLWGVRKGSPQTRLQLREMINTLLLIYAIENGYFRSATFEERVDIIFGRLLAERPLS